MPEPTPATPTIKELIARVEAAEKRADAAEQTAAAMIRASGEDIVSKVNSRLESDESLLSRYNENRRQNMARMLPTDRFWAKERGDSVTARENEELKSRLETLEQLVLEQQTTPKGKGR